MSVEHFELGEVALVRDRFDQTMWRECIITRPLHLPCDAPLAVPGRRYHQIHVPGDENPNHIVGDWICAPEFLRKKRPPEDTESDATPDAVGSWDGCPFKPQLIEQRS